VSTRSWMRPVGAAVAVGCVLASLVGGSAATASAAAVPSTPWAWGDNVAGQLGDGTLTVRYTPVQVSGLSGVTAIAGDYDQSLAVKSDGTALAWGFNAAGSVGVGSDDRRRPAAFIRPAPPSAHSVGEKVPAKPTRGFAERVHSDDSE
jgi:Regulator of chromosome condensation (RCC1) repeat